MLNVDGNEHVQKMWRIETTDATFAKEFRYKTCLGGHTHCTISGKETASTAYYPERWCRSMAQFWKRQDDEEHENVMMNLHLQPTSDALELYTVKEEENPTEDERKKAEATLIKLYLDTGRRLGGARELFGKKGARHILYVFLRFYKQQTY